MRILLTVIDGPRLVWNGSPVSAPAGFVDELRPGTRLFADCCYSAAGLSLSARPNVDLEFVPEAIDDDGVGALIVAGQFDAALRLIEGLPRTAETLGFKARALLERHRDHETRTTEEEQTDLAVGAAALKACLDLGGPAVDVDAVNSPWACWNALRRRETQPLSFELSVELLRWVWKAIPRSDVDDLEEFSPFVSLLYPRHAERWPAAPWLAWGLAPDAVDTTGFAHAMCDRLERLLPNDEEVQSCIRALRAGAKPPSGTRSGRRAVGLLKGLQVAMHSSRPKSVIEIARQATKGLQLDDRLEWFTMLNEALAIGEVAAALTKAKARPSSPVDQVLFRAIAGKFDIAPSISLLSNGRLLAVIVQENRRPTVVEGGVDEVVAVMPEPYFPTALVAVREGLTR